MLTDWLKSLVLGLGCSFLPALAAAQQGTGRHCNTAEHRLFNFWLGDWTVTREGKTAGRNRVTLEEDGCLVHEHWKGASGGSGQSLNFYDRTDQRWHQVWVSNDGEVLRLAGAYSKGAMRFTGRGVDDKKKPIDHRLTFFNNADGTVRQLWEITKDAGASWQTIWDAVYSKP